MGQYLLGVLSDYSTGTYLAIFNNVEHSVVVDYSFLDNVCLEKFLE